MFTMMNDDRSSVSPVRTLMTVRMRSMKMFTMIVRMMKRQDGQRDVGLVSITYFDSHLFLRELQKVRKFRN